MLLAATRALLVTVTLATTAGISCAQTTTPTPPAGEQSNGGLGPKVTDPSHVDKGQNMILPSAGQSGQSAAPTMVYDCKAKPQDCTTPATPADKATGPALSAPPATTTP